MLSDVDKHRWSDDVLIRFLNSGIHETVNITECLKTRLFLQLEDNVAVYDLSEFVLRFTKVHYTSYAVPLKTTDDLDTMSSTWQEDIGEAVKYVTVDNLPEGYIRIYPKITGSLDIISQNQVYGGLVDITVNEDIYKVPSFKDIPTNLKHYLAIYAVQKHPEINILTTDEDFILNTKYDTALEYYITGKAFRSDNDAVNRQTGNENLQLFNSAINSVKSTSSKASASIPTRTLRYKGFI